MLQQTTVAAVGPRYARFLARFPDVAALAAAPWDAVAEEWAGLGYYARARNLHAGAKVLAERGFPRTVEGLREIPGIGAYTAAAVAAIAFGVPVVPTDGNVERVTARVYAEEAPLPGAKRRLDALAQRWTEAPEARTRPGDFAQALFDLGATICTPKRPACALCPWMRPCAARAAGLQEAYPKKVRKVEGQLRLGAAFVVLRADDSVLLRTRPPSGLLGGMAEPPTSEWAPDYALSRAMLDAPIEARWKRLDGVVRHTFTHFPLELTIFLAKVPRGTPAPDGMRWTPRTALAEEALPGAMKKVLVHALGALPNPAPAAEAGQPS